MNINNLLAGILLFNYLLVASIELFVSNKRINLVLLSTFYLFFQYFFFLIFTGTGFRSSCQEGEIWTSSSNQRFSSQQRKNCRHSLPDSNRSSSPGINPGLPESTLMKIIFSENRGLKYPVDNSINSQVSNLIGNVIKCWYGF